MGLVQYFQMLKKNPWPQNPLAINYSVDLEKDAKEEGQAMASFYFGIESFRRHDSQKIVKHHCYSYKYKWPYNNGFW